MRGEHQRYDSSFGEMFRDLAGCATAGSAAECGDDDGGAHSVEMCIEHIWFVEKSSSGLSGESAGSASGETFAADKGERDVG